MSAPLNPTTVGSLAERMSASSLLMPSNGYIAFALSAIVAGAVLAFLT